MKTNTKTVTVVDMFCGAGGMTDGHVQACRELGFKTKMIAINHWDRAIETHSLNHPEAQHYCDEMQSLDPWAVVPGGKLDLLLAGPECTHFSKARGGKPKSNQSRASAWHIVRWAEALNIRAILIENVPEFESWGPLDAHGKPIESRKGETFQAFINALKSLNYRVDWRVLNCADFGDPTTRERLFVIALKANRTIPWPDPTHSPTGEQTLFGQLPKWKAAREIIDWSLAGYSIFNRKKPLSPNTMRRIMKGLRKFGGVSFVLPPEGIHRGNAPRSVDEPLPTVTSRGGGHLIQPYLVMMYGQNDARSVDRPLPTVTAGGGHIGLAQPFVIPQQSGGRPRSVEEPLPTVAAAGAIALVQPFIMAIRGGDDGTLRVRASAADQPMPALTTISPFALVEPFVVCTNHGADDGRTYPMDRPMPTVTSVDAWGVVQPFIVEYNGQGNAHSVDEPLPTVTGSERFGLAVTLADGTQGILDVMFRMLKPHELARAQSLGHMTFTGTRDEQVKQIGNAVPGQTAKQLNLAILRQLFARYL